MGSLGKHEEKHPDILDAELETGLGKNSLNKLLLNRLGVDLLKEGSQLGGEFWR